MSQKKAANFPGYNTPTKRQNAMSECAKERHKRVAKSLGYVLTLADRCNCAIELVHHTRKTNGEEATTESGRGASALLSAARSGRVLNKMNDEMKAEAGVQDDPATYFAVTRDKANLAPVGKREWRRMASVHLSNGDSAVSYTHLRAHET